MQQFRFPSLSGEALDGTAFDAARDLAGARTIALFGFAIEQRAEIEAWATVLDPLVRDGGLRARLFVALGRGMAMMRGMIAGAMRAAIADPNLRASTVLAFTDVDRLCADLGVGDRAHVAVVLVEADGTIGWRGSGPPSEALTAELTSRLR